MESVTIKRYPAPFPAETPLLFADRLGRFYSEATSKQHKKQYAQYLTPPDVAAFMASRITPLASEVRLLDPGAVSQRSIQRCVDAFQPPFSLTVIARQLGRCFGPASNGSTRGQDPVQHGLRRDRSPVPGRRPVPGKLNATSRVWLAPGPRPATQRPLSGRA